MLKIKLNQNLIIKLNKLIFNKSFYKKINFKL